MRSPLIVRRLCLARRRPRGSEKERFFGTVVRIVEGLGQLVETALYAHTLGPIFITLSAPADKYGGG